MTCRSVLREIEAAGTVFLFIAFREEQWLAFELVNLDGSDLRSIGSDRDTS
jgi:hypothetical protein